MSRADWKLCIAILETTWVIGLAVGITMQRRSPGATLAWIFGLAAFPGLGILIFRFLGPNRMERRITRLAEARRFVVRAARAGEAALKRLPEERRQLPVMCTTLTGIPPETARSVTLYGTGDDTYDAIVAAIRTARHHVHVEYYIFRPDRSGQLIRDALIERAQHGVQVRLLIDGIGSGRLPRAFRAPLVAAGVELARFNRAPLWRRAGRFLNFRTHRKIVVVDGVVGFTGGINVCDDHSARARPKTAWRDTHLRLEGHAVWGLQRVFFEHWSYALKKDKQGKKPVDLSPYFPDGEVGDEVVQVVPSGPDSDSRAIEALYLVGIHGARRRIWLTTPYFIPDEALLWALASAGLRGVDVRLMVPRRSDSRLIDAAGRSFHETLARAGVRVYFYGASMIHAKTCVIDDDLAIVGSANLDYRSFRLNFECVVAVHGGPAVAALAALYEADLARADERRPADGRESFGERLAQSAARLLAPQL